MSNEQLKCCCIISSENFFLRMISFELKMVTTKGLVFGTTRSNLYSNQKQLTHNQPLKIKTIRNALNLYLPHSLQTLLFSKKLNWPFSIFIYQGPCFFCHNCFDFDFDLKRHFYRLINLFCAFSQWINKFYSLREALI